MAAAEALGRIYASLIERGNAVNLAPLEQLLTDHDPEVRRATIEALQRVYPRHVRDEGAASLHELERALDDEAAEVRAAAQDLFASVLRAVLSGQEGAGFAETLRELDKELNEPLSAPLSGAYSPFVLLEKDALQVGRLTLKKKRLRTNTQPCIVTKSSSRDALRYRLSVSSTPSTPADGADVDGEELLGQVANSRRWATNTSRTRSTRTFPSQNS